MIEGKSREWPLVGFTVGLELCCGITIVTATLDLLGSASRGSVRGLGLSILPLTLLAILASTFHLGRPFSFWRAFINVCQSRLSSEIALTALFGALTLVYTPMWFGARSEARIVLGIATAATGILAVISSARVYTIPTQPFWNSGWVPCSFLGATVLLAGIIATPFIPNTGPSRLLLIARAATAASAVILFASALWMLRRLSNIVRERQASPDVAPLFTATEWTMFLGFILLAGVSPLVFSSTFALVSGGYDTLLPTLAVVLGLVGVTLGRVLMYSFGTSLSRF